MTNVIKTHFMEIFFAGLLMYLGWLGITVVDNSKGIAIVELQIGSVKESVEKIEEVIVPKVKPASSPSDFYNGY